MMSERLSLSAIIMPSAMLWYLGLLICIGLANSLDCASIGTSKPANITSDNRFGLWPGLSTQHDLAYGENIFGVNAAIERIWKNQNPRDCSKAKYLISGEWNAGFGSEFYYHTVPMALALDTGKNLHCVLIFL